MFRGCKVRDNLRALVYAKEWKAASEQAETFLLKAHTDLGVHDVSQESIWTVLKPLCEMWATCADDLVAPVIAHELAERRKQSRTPDHHHHDQGTASATTSDSSEGQTYGSLFVVHIAGKAAYTQLFLDLPARYPLLFERIHDLLMRQVRNLELCLRRFVKDYGELSEEGLAPLIQIEPALDSPTTRRQTGVPVITGLFDTDSDPHGGGQTVLIVELWEGTKLVYKPFGGTSSQFFAGVLANFNADPAVSESFRLRAMRVVASDDHDIINGNQYCWAEFIEYKQSDSIEQVQSFYRKAGALLGLCHLLGFSDGHDGNVICDGQGPVLVDCETLFQPFAHLEADPIKGILGTMMVQASPPAFDVLQQRWVAAFQPSPETAKFSRHLTIHADRTIDMSVRFDSVGVEPTRSIPRLHGRPQHLREFVDEFLSGFALAQGLGAKLIDNPVLLGAIAECTSRIVLRQTALYGLVLRRAMQADAYRSQVAAERAVREALSAQNISDFADVLELEVEALLRADIPAFYFKPASATLFNGDGKEIPDFLRRIAVDSGWAGGPVWQPVVPHGIMTASLKSRLADIALANVETLYDVSDSTLMDFAFSVSKLISQSLARSLVLTNATLYQGSTGLMLFFCAMFATSREDSFRELAIDLWGQVQKQLVDPAQFADLPLGACNGIGGVIFALTHAAQLLERPDMLQAAIDYCRRVPLQRIHADRLLDFADGVAGYAASLLTLDHFVPEERGFLYKQVVACSERLQTTAIIVEPGRAYWTRPDQPGPLTGFAHGNAGITHSLHALAVYLQSPSLAQLAVHGETYENDHFRIPASNWGDLREGLETTDGKSWCYGSPGILVSRHGHGYDRAPLSSHLDDVSAGIDRACRLSLQDKSVSELVLSDDLLQRTCLCCGVSGCIDMRLLLATINSPGLGSTALRELAITSGRTDMKDLLTTLYQIYRTSGFHDDIDIALFSGLTGIAYTCVRLSFPDLVPSALVFPLPLSIL